MNPIVTLLACALMLLPGPGLASGFEYCDLEGSVRSATAAGASRTYDIHLTITDAKRARENGELSYTDCSEHVGKPMQIRLKLPRRTATPAAGDRLRFSRSVVDGFHADGTFAGSSVTTKLLK
jgi:hypothetical protein